MKQNNRIWQVLAPIIVIFLLLALFSRRIFFMMMILVIAIAFIGVVFWLVQYLAKMGAEDDLMQTVDEGMARQLATCNEQIQKNKREINEIRQNIADLESSMDKDMELMDDYRRKSKKILAGFYREMDLRKAKIEFYATCKTKLETVQYNQNFSKKLSQKQQKLNELQEDHYEDLAAMETFKTNLEYNKRFMEDIETLSLKMLESNSLDTAQQLQLELKEITKELRRL